MSIAMAEVVRIDTLDQIIHVYENAEKLYGNKSINETLREYLYTCLLYTSPSPRDGLLSRMPSSA